MERVLASAGLIVLLSASAAAQTAPASTPQTSPVFDVADVHSISSSSGTAMRGGFIPGGLYELHTASLLDLIRTAYGVEADAIFGGPSWLDSDRFEIIAKTEPNSTAANRELMLRALLADRFKLVVHKEDKPQDVFVLTIGKRALMNESAGGGPSDCKPPEDNKPQPYISLNCSNMTMADFAKQFRRMAGGYVTHPIVDQTGLDGAYDFSIHWTPRQLLLLRLGGDSDPNPAISFFDAIEKQLGLKLVEGNRPLPAIVVDSVNRTPTPNLPGVSASLPTVPTEFEVAMVKPSKPGDMMQRIQPKAGGRIEIENIQLKRLIRLAWDIDEDRIVGAPKWIESDHFDIVAKTADFPLSAPPPFDVLRPMLRALLMERFQLKVHNEDQPVEVWSLTVGRHGAKLKTADPSSRTGCKTSLGQQGSSTAALPMINYTCQNTTMQQLAEAMHRIAGGYVDRPAVDMTGLTGSYDFTISWTPVYAMNGLGRIRSPEGQQLTPVADDPSGGTSFFSAVEKQLGLHLEKGRKVSMPVLVIDHIGQLMPDN